MKGTTLISAGALGLALSSGAVASGQMGPQTTIQGEITAVSGYTIALQPDAGGRVMLDDRRAIAAHQAYGVQPYNHVIVTGSYALNGRFYATAIRSYESREFAFRARITSVDGNRVGMIRQDNGRPFVVDDTPAIAAHRAYGVHPGTLVVVEGKYGSDHLFRANRIEYVR